MKAIIRSLALLLAALFLLCACTDSKGGAETTGTDTVGPESVSGKEPDADDPQKSGGTVVNVDGDALYWLYLKYNRDLSDLEDKCVEFFNDKYTDCGISDLLYDISMSVKSDTWETNYDKYLRKEENGVAVDFTDDDRVQATYRIYTETDVDPYGIWFDLCRHNGINPWISFRMNDVHFADEATGHNAFFYEAKKNGWFIGNSRASYWATGTTAGSRTRYPYCLNYKYSEVRQHYLDNIDEMLGRYDVYGIELDWQRCIWSFTKDSVDNCKYMNIMLEEVNKIVGKYEEQYGHKIKIMIRLGRDIEENRYFGFDVLNFAKNDWIDVVVPSPYWGSTDSDMPIAEWVEALKQYPSVEIYAGLECNTIHHTLWQSVPSLAGYTAAYLTAGADKIYLFNLFNDIKPKFAVCSSLENAMNAVRRSFIVTGANLYPYTGTLRTDAPLPVSLKINGKPAQFELNHGLLDYEKDTVVYIGVSGVTEDALNENLLSVTYDGVACIWEGVATNSCLGDNTNYGTVVKYRVPKEAADGKTAGTLKISPGVNVVLNYVELANGNTRV